MDSKKTDAALSRRDFVKYSTAAIGAAAVAAAPSFVHAAGSDTLKVGLIGCGGRGGGAAQQALKADSNAKLIALADMFPDKLEKGLAGLKASEEVGARVDVKDDHKFTGWEGYK